MYSPLATGFFSTSQRARFAASCVTWRVRRRACSIRAAKISVLDAASSREGALVENAGGGGRGRPWGA